MYSAFVTVVFLAGPACAALIDFDDLVDSTTVSDQYSGIVFKNTIAVTAGITLNDFEFPPHSGSGVAIDAGGPMQLSFATPIVRFGGYFTYSAPLRLTAYDSMNYEVASTLTLFKSNLALSGEPNSAPNEFKELVVSSGMTRIEISGLPAGSSFTVDDVSLARVTDVPEPSFGHLLVLLVLAASPRLLMRRGGSHEEASS
jgi:hypothetical protein